MGDSKSYYEILQVDPEAEQEVIEAAYRRLARKYHPDTNKSPDAKVKMQHFNEAYSVLRDPVTRAQYDKGLRRPSVDSNTQRHSQWQAKEEPQRDTADSRHKWEAEQQRQEEASRAATFKTRKLSFMTCPKCGEDNPANTFLCVRCGHNLQSKPERVIHASNQHQQTTNVGRFLICPRCGEQNHSLNMHCVHCGERLLR